MKVAKHCNRGCGLYPWSFSGHGPEQPAVVGPALSRRWTGQSPEVPSNHSYSVHLQFCWTVTKQTNKKRQFTSNGKGQGPDSGVRAGLRVRSHVNKSVINLQPHLFSFHHLFRNVSTIKWFGLFVLKTHSGM